MDMNCWVFFYSMKRYKELGLKSVFMYYEVTKQRIFRVLTRFWL